MFENYKIGNQIEKIKNQKRDQKHKKVWKIPEVFPEITRKIKAT